MVKFTVKADMAGVPRAVSRVTENPQLGMFAATEAARLMQQFVPERDRVLINSTRFSPFEVTYTAPYAAYQFYGRGLRHSKPSAKSHWHEDVDKTALAAALQGYVKARL